VIGVLLLVLGMFEGCFGYSLPDDLLSGTGIRATLPGITLALVGGAFLDGAIGIAVLIGALITYPWLERRLSGDLAHHNLVQRPRDVPVRTSIGMMALAFYGVLTLSSFNDIIALQFALSLNATTWAGRIGLLLAPPLAYAITYRGCLALQRSDREVLEHGVETGIITRSPGGTYLEIHQPLAPSRGNGHAPALTYQGDPGQAADGQVRA
jgi:ubiquinol-cytochrome c reductase cytochrome b subunit